MPGPLLEVYRLFSPSFCLAQREQLLNTCFLQNLVASGCLKNVQVSCAKSLTLQQVYIAKISHLPTIRFNGPKDISCSKLSLVESYVTNWVLRLNKFALRVTR